MGWCSGHTFRLAFPGIIHGDAGPEVAGIPDTDRGGAFARCADRLVADFFPLSLS